MSDDGKDSSAAGALQFERAEFAGARDLGATCTACQKPIEGTYYQANGHVICAGCHAGLQRDRDGGSGAGRFFRAAALGLLAAALGSTLYYGVRALTGYEFGLIAIVVGVMVGGAVRRGSKGRGGWLYQALAMLLTYGSIVSTYVPDIVKEIVKQGKQQEATAAAGATKPDTPESGPQPAATAAPPAKPQAGGLPQFLLAVVLLFAFAFAAPFLAGFQNIMGLIIIGIGLYEAWKMNRRVPLVLSGPYRVAPVATPPAP